MVFGCGAIICDNLNCCICKDENSYVLAGYIIENKFLCEFCAGSKEEAMEIFKEKHKCLKATTTNL